MIIGIFVKILYKFFVKIKTVPPLINYFLGVKSDYKTLKKPM